MRKNNHFILVLFSSRGLFLFAIILFFSQSILNAQNITGGFYLEGHHRSYTVFLPENYSAAINLPLVIYLHGYGWTVQQDMNYT